MEKNVFEKLHSVFGFETFRKGQAEIVEAILLKRDVVGVLPTGAGKSLCYQLPALILEGLTIVVSPLISLMKDQVDGLKSLGVSAEILNTSLSYEDSKSVFKMAKSGELKLLYVSPERLANSFFVNASLGWNVSMVVVDEAHCVSQWGHDFRPNYKDIRSYVCNFLNRPVFSAFTATATVQVRKDIIKQLGLEKPLVVVNSFDRPNLFFECKACNDKCDFLKKHLPSDETSIVYCNTRKNVELVFSFLNANGFSASMYHAGLSSEKRKQSQDAFMNDEIKIIVATNAFGMGINKADVRNVFHYNMPKNLEAYYQEAGRAGRDGLSAKAVLLYSKWDFATARFLIRNSKEPFVLEKLNKMISYCNSSGCLRAFILEYFGEKQNVNLTDSFNCGKCSICVGDFITQDKTIEAQKILSCVYRMNQRFGTSLVCDVLRGSKSKKVEKYSFNELSTYGIMKDYSSFEIKDIVVELVAQSYLKIGEYQVLYLTQKSKDILNGKVRFNMKEPVKNKKVDMSYNYENIDTPVPNHELYQKLKDLRFKLSVQLNKPAYTVFSNKTLMDISAKCPRNFDEFLMVKGVGEKKLDAYGKIFLKEIAEFFSEN
ncbi:MAG: DNA helicase RecQ [Treponema sp.]|nr:MAG: DNA helicase RecQ [Treponema sp.]